MQLLPPDVTRLITAAAISTALAACTARGPVSTFGTNEVPAAKTPARSEAPGSAGAASANAIDEVSIAANLASLGHRTNSPLALATAAQLLLDNPVGALAATPSTEGSGAGAGVGSKPGAQVSLDVNQLLSAAQTAGRDNPNVVALVAQLQQRNSSGAKGATYGAISNYYSVPANSTHSFRLTFDGGSVASIRVRGDGDTDLDCWVFDANGRMVDSDDDYTDYCVLDWYPRSTSQHRLVIKNWHTEVYNRYLLLKN